MKEVARVRASSESPPKVLYVAGYGRSGSTLMGRVLADERGVVALGEMHAVGAGTAERMCACGRRFSTCPYWAGITRELSTSGASGLSLPLARLLNGWWGLVLPMTVLRRLVNKVAIAPAFAAVPLPEALSVLCAGSSGAVVDISKTTRTTANRPRLLAAAGAEIEIYVPRRDVEAVVASSIRAAQRRGRTRTVSGAGHHVRLCRTLAHLSARWCARSLGCAIEYVPFDTVLSRARAITAEEVGNHMLTGNRARGEVVV